MNFLIITDHNELYLAERLQPDDFQLIKSTTIRVVDLRTMMEIGADYKTKTLPLWEE